MNMLCMACGAHYDGPTISCVFCGSVLPALTVQDVLAPERDDGNSRSSVGLGGEADASEALQEVVFAQAIQVGVVGNASGSFELASGVLQGQSDGRSKSSPVISRTNGTHGKIDKQSAIAIGILLTVVVGIAGNFLFNTKKSELQTSSNSPAAVAMAPAAESVKVQTAPTALESRWFGKWVAADGKKRIEITAQNIEIATDEWKRSPDDKTNIYNLSWTTGTELGEGQFGYAGKSTSPSDIRQSYGQALADFRKGSLDFAVSPTDDNLAQRWIAMLAPKSYQILHGYPGGDSLPTEWILDDYGNMLEVNAGHYGFHLRLLQREGAHVLATGAAPNQSSNKSPPAESVEAPNVRVGDAYTYETLDLIEPKLNNVTNREIVEVSPGGFVMSIVNAKSKYARRLSYDGSLNLVSTRSGDSDGANFSPALQYFKFPLRIGESWSSSSTETNIKTGKVRTHTLKGMVGASEIVTVPAGTFKAYRITIKSELQEDGQVSTGQDISWYSSEVRRTVKSELESRDSAGKIGRRNINLTSYSLR